MYLRSVASVSLSIALSLCAIVRTREGGGEAFAYRVTKMPDRLFVPFHGAKGKDVLLATDYRVTGNSSREAKRDANRFFNRLAAAPIGKQLSLSLSH